MWDSSPKHFVAKNCLKDYFWSQILLLSARRGRPRRERSQHLRKQIVRIGLFWMGADDCASEKIQTRAGHIYRVTLVLWPALLVCANISSDSSIRDARRWPISEICGHRVCSSQTRCSRKPREPQYQCHAIDMTSPSLIFFRDAIICAHPEQTVSYDLFSEML